MIFEPAAFTGTYVIQLKKLEDDRGWFARTYCDKSFEEHGLAAHWVQMNHSFNRHAGTIRGLHFQNAPHAETKLVRCVRGKVFDVLVDLRPDSPTYLKWLGIELSAENQKMLYIPKGIAHGFQTLEDFSELVYSHSEFYNKEAEGGIRFNDPQVNIQWPLPVAHISERDLTHPFINQTQ